MAKTPIIVSLDTDVIKRLDALKPKLQRSRADLIREGIKMFLAKYTAEGSDERMESPRSQEAIS